MAKPDYYNITLRVMGPDVDAEQVTQALECEPTHLSDQGGWRLSVEGDVEDLNAGLESLFDGVVTDSDVWEAITEAYRCDVFVGVFCIDKVNFGFRLSPENMSLLGRLGLEMDLDVYV